MAEAQPSVFISYARADDEPFVERLHRDLEAAGIDVWWDRDKMASRGRTFLQEIRDAIEAVDRVIAVIGSAASPSDYVRYEWEHSGLFAKGLLPILRLGITTWCLPSCCRMTIRALPQPISPSSIVRISVPSALTIRRSVNWSRLSASRCLAWLPTMVRPPCRRMSCHGWTISAD